MSTEKEQEIQRTTAARGFRFGLHEFLAEMDVGLLKQHNEGRAYHNPQKKVLVDWKTKELLSTAAYIARTAEIPIIQCHMHAAVKAGATKEEIWEALEHIESWVGSVALAKGIEAWRATFRPDLPTIERVVELR
jgi:alkylhydroperoxidase/carboxymuconolactone decarboxylase family protein YurZ